MRTSEKPAPTVLFFSSPMMCVLAWGILSQLRSQLRSQLESQLWSQLESQLWSQLESQLESQLWSQLRSQLESQLRSQLESQLWSQLWSQLRSQLESQLWSQLRSQLESQLWSQLRSQLESQLWSQLESQLESQLRSQLRSQLESQLWSHGVPPSFAGQHWCAWEVFYVFCGEIGVRYPADEQAKLDLWLRQSRAMHWWFPFEGIVLASERHTDLHVDDRGRLHAAEGQACGYSDGWGVNAWHGVIIPDRYYSQQQAAAEILGESNIEVRRALIERYDYLTAKGRFLQDCGAKVLDSAVQPMRPGEAPAINELLAIDLPGDPDGRIVSLKVIDPSTGRGIHDPGASGPNVGERRARLELSGAGGAIRS